MIVTVCADKGSPGVSWTAAAVTMLWPGERVLLEADPSGGDAALRLRTPAGQLLARQPTLRGLAVDARGGALPSFAAYAHQTSLGVPVISATDMRTEDFGLIARHWPAIASAANAWRGTVIADVGRLQEESASGPVAAASTIVLLIGRPTPEGLYHMRERARALAARLGQGLHGRSPLAVAVICPAREHTARLADLRVHLTADPATSEIPVAGWIADDPRAVALMREGQVTKKLMTSDLIRSTSSLVEALVSSWPPLRDTADRAPAPAPAPAPDSAVALADVVEVADLAGQASPHPPSTEPLWVGPPVVPSMTTGGWS